MKLWTLEEKFTRPQTGDVFYVQNYQTLAITIFAIERGGKSTGGIEGENRSLR